MTRVVHGGVRARIVAVIVVASLAMATRVQAAPRCRLAPSAGVASEPCLQLAAPSPWVDEGAAPAAFAPRVTAARDRRVLSLGALGGIYVAFSTWAYFAWYHGKPDLPEFTVGGDGYFGEHTYAGGADKLGHAWANLALSRATTELLRWGGWSRGEASVLASSLSWLLFAFVEIKDGYYYQLSPGDMYANTAGAALSALMVNVPAVDRAIDFRVEVWPSPEYRHEFRDGNVNIAEDYSGQTYFLAYHLSALPRAVKPPPPFAGWLDYVDLGVGFQARRYKPDPPDGVPRGLRRQDLFLGVTIDLQRVVDRVLGGRTSGAARVTRAIGHGLLEVFSPPSTIVPLVGVGRSPDP